MFLEDGDWSSANDYCEKVLDIDPENAQAYLGKLLANLRVRNQVSLKDQEVPFDNNNNYQKAIRFGDEELKTVISGYIDHINTRNENARLEDIYTKAKNLMSIAETESFYKEAAELFESISEYQDADVLAKSCYEKAEAARKDAILAKAKKKMSFYHYKSAISLFESISGWKDADEQIIVCQNSIKSLRLENEKRAKRNKKIAIITIPIVCIIIAFIIILNAVIIPNGKYNDAVALVDAGNFDEAIEIFNELDGYKDSVDKINKCNTSILDGKYNNAIALADAENFDEAYSIFIELGDYKDASNKAGNVRLTKTKEQLKSIKVGDYITFGAYEQDNNTSNGKEDIEWLVLDKKEEKTLVVSKYALDCQQYNTTYTDVTWETCSLRDWMNSDFLNSAFSDEEKAMIPSVTVSADNNPEYSTNAGNATQDKVFLLSITEAEKYFASYEERKCVPTEYAIAQGAYISGCYAKDGRSTLWWLRSPGDYQLYAASVSYVGSLNYDGLYVNCDFYCFRPALWIDIT